jgi:hypothetical protein
MTLYQIPVLHAWSPYQAPCTYLSQTLVKLSNKSHAPVMCRWLPLYKNHAILPRKASHLPKSQPSNELLPNSIIQVTKLFVSTHTLQLNLCPLSETVPSCGWTLSLVHSRPPQLISASVLILLGQIPHTLSHLDNVQLSGPMKTLSHQTAIHTSIVTYDEIRIFRKEAKK